MIPLALWVVGSSVVILITYLVIRILVKLEKLLK